MDFVLPLVIYFCLVPVLLYCTYGKKRWAVLVVSCVILPCLVLSCLVLSCLFLPCLALPCLASPCLALLCFALACLFLPCFVLACLALLCVGLACLVLSCCYLMCRVLKDTGNGPSSRGSSRGYVVLLSSENAASQPSKALTPNPSLSP
jgi:hypothetical protein